jgi:hypothetical protein
MVESDLPDDDTFDRDGTIHPEMQRKDAVAGPSKI